VLQTTAFRYSTTPDRLSIVNITDEGVLVDVTVRCGIDVDRALGIGLTPAQAEHAAKMRWRGAGAEWWERLREWSVDRARGYVPGHVHLDVLEPIHVSWNGTRLVTATIVGPAHVPVVQRARIADKQDWLRPMDLRILAKPDSMDALWTFVQHSWREKVQVAVKTEAVGTVLGYSLERSIDMPVSLKRESARLARSDESAGITSSPAHTRCGLARRHCQAGPFGRVQVRVQGRSPLVCPGDSQEPDTVRLYCSLVACRCVPTGRTAHG
jgi:hypothetical protein